MEKVMAKKPTGVKTISDPNSLAFDTKISANR